jgi:hypothetical protein
MSRTIPVMSSAPPTPAVTPLMVYLVWIASTSDC